MSVLLKTGQTRESVMDSRRRAVLDRLINATETLLVDMSVTDVSLTDILSRADVAKATFYKLFNDLIHLFQFVTEGLLSVCREYQLRGYERISPEDWRGIFASLCDGAASFYHDHPAAMRLWLANDSPASIRAVDQASDDAFLNWFHGRYADTRWHARLPDAASDVDVLTASFRVYDAVLALGFQRVGHRVPQRYFNEAKRAHIAYLAARLEPK